MRYKSVPLFFGGDDIVVENPDGDPVDDIDFYGAPKYRISLVREEEDILVTDKKQTRPRMIYNTAQEIIKEFDREVVCVFCMDIQMKIIGVNIAHIGSVSGSLVHPREVYKPAILLNSFGIVTFHNHPSGNPIPSEEDIEIAKRLDSAGDTLGIDMLDFLVVTYGEGYTSLREEQLI